MHKAYIRERERESEREMVGCILFCYQSSRGCKLKQFIMGIVLLQELVELNLEDARVVVVCGVRIQVRVTQCCEDDCTDCWGVFGRDDYNGHACTGVWTRSREDVLWFGRQGSL